MDDNARWKVRVSKALLQTHCMYRQAIVARGGTGQPANPAYQTLL